MVPKYEPASSIIEYLSTQYEEKSVSDISISLGMNRNLVAKYLSILLMQGRVELKSHGTMKVYRLSNRIPFFLLSRLNEGFLLGFDQFLIIKENNGELPPFFYSDTKVIGKKIQILSHLGLLNETIFHTINLALDGQGPFNHQIQSPSYWHHIKVIPIIFDDRTIGVAISINDITHIKNLELTEILWKSRYLELTEQNPDMVLHLSPDGKITSANRAYLSFHQISKRDIIGTTILPGLMIEDQKNFINLIHSLSFTNPYSEIILQSFMKNGSITWIKWNIFGSFINQNLIEVHLQGIDITKEKDLEKKNIEWKQKYQTLLKEKNIEIHEITQKLSRVTEEVKIHEYKNQIKTIEIQSLLQSTHNVILLIDNLGVVENINDGFSKTLNLPFDEIVGKNIRELLFPADVHIFDENMYLLSTRFQPFYQLELRFLDKDESFVFVELSGVPKLSPEKRKLSINCVGQIITQQKKVETELKRFTTIMGKTSDIIKIYNKDGYLEYINQAGRRLFEIPESDPINSYNMAQFIRKTSRKELNLALKIASEKGVWRGELNLISFTGRDIPVTEEIISYRDSLDESLIYLTVARDNSEKLIHFHELHRINAYHRGLLETSVDSLIFIGLDGIILDANRSIERITGYHRDELIGLKFSTYIVSPEQVEDGIMKVFNEGIVRNYSINIKHRNGQIIPVECNASIFRDEDGNIKGIFVSARDMMPT
ncbi:PAS domain S-box protein [Methanospirillum lacunae]|uniref:histidine kinase n=1 Tax=Methanospirillum lacunae TaxID=668570 RepID=A0A2V2NFZ4_9EURY|nr:PAS domain S-box protein [Methanospirillum lacunae]PWR74233.1 hypothetical protein DK846_03525 [Methanospirillum lacunae]